MKEELMVKGTNFVKFSICMSLFFIVTKGYPTGNTEKQIQSAEKQYPNGTVIGKYAYLDKEGNPVEVKYYADESSYGVELNSFKAIHGNQGEPVAPEPKQANKIDETPSKVDKEVMPDTHAKSDLFDSIATFKYPEPASNNKYKTTDNPLPKQEGYPHQKIKYKSPDYEVYAKDDMDSQQCGPNNEKVKVYNFLKEKEVKRGFEEPEEEEEEVGGGEFCDI
ncbi:hypothetical protein NE865_02805 [Phthorimaea operculella]|nr:hypothetical protein NE865_02805 [Phthorimaea operculella]